MIWIYILKCENGYYYVGKTKRLYRRFWEHETGKGGLNTAINVPECVVAIYKVNLLDKFIFYNNIVTNKISENIYFMDSNTILDDFNNSYISRVDCDEFMCENYITETLMLHNKSNRDKIRGGKYTRFDIEYKLPTDESENTCLPSCDCGFPCDIKKDEENNYLYFRCAKKNIWDDMKNIFDVENEPCKYFMIYTRGIKHTLKSQKKMCRIKELTAKSSYWLRDLVAGQYEFCLGGCGKEYDGNNTIRYSRKSINLCFDCFINKNDELSKKYTQCMIESDDDF